MRQCAIDSVRRSFGWPAQAQHAQIQLVDLKMGETTTGESPQEGREAEAAAGSEDKARSGQGTIFCSNSDASGLTFDMGHAERDGGSRLLDGSHRKSCLSNNFVTLARSQVQIWHQVATCVRWRRRHGSQH